MTKPVLSPRTTVNLGPREWVVAEKMQRDRDLPSVAFAVRNCVTVAAAVDMIESHHKMRFECIAKNGRRYGYSLNRPKQLEELDTNGNGTGRMIDLFDAEDSKVKKSKLKSIKGGKALAGL